MVTRAFLASALGAGEEAGAKRCKLGLVETCMAEKDAQNIRSLRCGCRPQQDAHDVLSELCTASSGSHRLAWAWWVAT